MTLRRPRFTRSSFTVPTIRCTSDSRIALHGFDVFPVADGLCRQPFGHVTGKRERERVAHSAG
jgi:hypothetical protein